MNKYLLAFLCVAFSACSNNIVLDNPSSAPVTFKIDEGEAVEVPAQSQKEISLDAGRHHIQVGTTFRFQDNPLWSGTPIFR